uniref:Nose resistant-to-fluoxetine protein N-terminal domain-containing protein n=1 Tax=Biomphalaria glabrata TaxID=6526 RepID=A0A2C9KQZ1_BIOGL
MQMIPMFSPFLYPSSPKCAEHRGRVFEGIIQQKIWAMKFVDSFGKLGSGIFQGNTIIMGNYDLCLSADDGNGTSGSFIELKFLAPVPVTTLITSGFANQQNGLPFLYWHICLPTQCNKADAESIGKKFADESGINLVETLIHESKSPTEDTCFIIAVIILSVLGAFCLAGTVIDVFTKDEEEEVARGEDVTVGASGLNAEQEPQSHNESVIVTGIRVIPGNQNEALTPPTVGQHVLPRRTSEILKTEKSNNVSGQPADVTVDAVDANSDISNGSTFIDRSSLTSRRSSLTWRRSNELGVLGSSLLAFSLPTNLRDILNAKHSPGDIKCLHGIRVLTISWVILGHCYYQAPYYINQTTLLDMSRWWTFQGILNAPFAVDTFFMLSRMIFIVYNSVTDDVTCQHQKRYHNSWIQVTENAQGKKQELPQEAVG